MVSLELSFFVFFPEHVNLNVKIRGRQSQYASIGLVEDYRTFTRLCGSPKNNAYYEKSDTLSCLAYIGTILFHI